MLRIYDSPRLIGPGTSREVAASLYGNETRKNVAAVSAYLSTLHRMGLVRRKACPDLRARPVGPVPFLYEVIGA